MGKSGWRVSTIFARAPGGKKIVMDRDRPDADDGGRKRFAWLEQPAEDQARRDIGIGRIYVATLVLVALAVLATAAGWLDGSTTHRQSGVTASKLGSPAVGAVDRRIVTR
jgi:hypothetical protein